MGRVNKLILHVNVWQYTTNINVHTLYVLIRADDSFQQKELTAIKDIYSCTIKIIKGLTDKEQFEKDQNFMLNNLIPSLTTL